MEQSSMKVDLDSLLQSHGGVDSDSSDEVDSTLSYSKHRTVDEILLNNSSSSCSPSPPSSPKLLHSHPSTSVVELNKFKSSTTSASFDSSSSSRIKSADENTAPSSFSLSRIVLPPLFINGAVSSQTKPGAALAAAAAASRSVPTPHAAAIKLRRANTSALQSVALEATAIVASVETSSSSAASKDSEVGSETGSESHGLRVLENSSDHSEEVKLDVFQSAQAKVRLTETVGTIDDPTESAQILTSDETSTGAATVDEHLTIGEQVSERLISESHISSTVENEKQLEFNENRVDSVLDEVNENKQVLSSLSNDNSDVNTEINYVDESNEIKDMAVPSPPSLISNDTISSDEIVSLMGEEEANDKGDVMDESRDVDDASSQYDAEDITEELGLKSESKRGRRKSQKKSQSSLKPLELAEELEKKQAFKGMHYEEGVTSQPMRLEGVRRGSTVLGYFDVNANNTITHTISSQAFRRDHGTPQVLSVNFNYIAIGMSKGTIVIVPSKYIPHQVDNMDAKMSVLGLQGDRTHVPVTSMCFNQPGDLLFAGYGDGHYTVWDVQRTSALRVINDHKAPVVHMLYVGQDTQVTRQFNVVSGDSKGVVKLIRFSVVPWLNRISYSKSMKLLDETTSRVVCASPLLSGEVHGGAHMSSQGSSAVSTGSISSMMGSVVEEGVVIFVTHQSALVAKVNPTVEVYAQIPKPDGIREGAMPYAAWRCISRSPGSSTENAPADTLEKLSLLAIAWDQKVQIAKLVKSDLKILEKWTLESPAVGLAWLDDQMLVILTLTRQLYLFAKDGNVIHQTSFAVDGLRGDDLISSHIYFTDTLGNPEKAYHNCVAVRGATIYILGPEHLIVSRFLPWKERIEVLRKAGDWMGALNMAMTLYDGQSHGVIDLPKNLDDIQRSIMPYLVELLLTYVTEVFSYISVACCNQNGTLDQSNEIKEQYTRVGGVAVEFCVHIRRTDILFDEIVSKFDEAQHKELLEPYILKDMLGSLPPAIMQALVEHYSEKGWLQRVEQCVLHMDILSLDFNQVVRLCREHRLHGALIYLFNKGLDDFRAPLEELLVVLRNSERESAASLGYRMLVYLKYCFQGLAFPPGHGNLSPTRLPSLRKELVQFLLEISSAQNAWTDRNLPSNGACPNLLHLLELDTEATLDVLRFAFPEEDEIGHFSEGSMNLELAEVNDSMDESQILVQKVVDVLADILDGSYFQTGSSINSDDINSREIWPSKKDAGHMYDFTAYHVACGRANVSNKILTQILEYFTSEINISQSLSGQTTEIIRRREKQLLALVEVVPETRWDTPYLLHLCAKAQFYQVCGCIHAIKHQYVAALDNYMKATDEPVLTFSFIHIMLKQLSEEERDAFESAVISRIPDLLKLSREGTYFLIVDHLSGQSQYILSALRSHPESLFLYLKTVIEVNTTGNLNLSSLKNDNNLYFPSARRPKQQSSSVEAYLQTISGFPKLLHNSSVQITDEMTELYLELLCQYERKSVLKFLETSESYRVEHCLRLCQEYRITDAAAFLLERVGDVGSALLLVLSDLNDKMIVLNAAIEDGLSGASLDHLNAVLKRKEVIEILDIVHACISLCQRNSPRLDPDESEYLWFQLLDSFCKPLMDSDGGSTNSKSKAPRETLDGSFGHQGDEEGSKIKWKFSKSHKGARIMTKLISMFIKEIVEGMIGYVQLPRIMSKLLSDNGNQEFGDFKLTILGMLGTYDFERRILDTAKSLIEDDTYYTLSLLRKGASHGYSPWSTVCCICNGLLAKSPDDSGIQIFSCGHAIHLHCELPENGASVRGSSTGCPICMPRKKAQKSSSISLFAQNGLVSKSSSRSQQPHGTLASHPHDYDSFENSYGSQPVSRFELLNNLQKDHKSTQMENRPPLRLAPPAIYHEKIIKKRSDDLEGESSSSSSRGLSKTEKPTRSRQLKDVKVKGSLVRFPLKSNIFGKEKTSKR
ncbi:vacuolar protein sorting-associated protein 8 homolog isoform X2 [Olea europaea var. sylvestris]|uniref:vacuolar protein sorting-associated protein 8 homolog isoform X2 n=1 Tax=Olea europaea var. sylvestris TaxID=158386 RepID=UPI000C1D5F82|nr:vacuolar protein sorting-associated protein 8 homolog isoform X2 [Olea europaea var. sylvestris]